MAHLNSVRKLPLPYSLLGLREGTAFLLRKVA
jgi:hypothetical protein